jgi:hypothetical protein
MTESAKYPNRLKQCCQECSEKVKEIISFTTILPFIIAVLVLGIASKFVTSPMLKQVLNLAFLIALAYVYFSLMCWPRTYCNVKQPSHDLPYKKV